MGLSCETLSPLPQRITRKPRTMNLSLACALTFLSIEWMNITATLWPDFRGANNPAQAAAAGGLAAMRKDLRRLDAAIAAAAPQIQSQETLIAELEREVQRLSQQGHDLIALEEQARQSAR